MKQELERIGYLGDMDASYKAMPIGVGVFFPLSWIKLILQAHFELHIGGSTILTLIIILTDYLSGWQNWAMLSLRAEQGPILESSSKKIGAVQGARILYLY